MAKKTVKKKTARAPKAKVKKRVSKTSSKKAAAKKASLNPKATKLLIVESPTKVRTIQKFLGPEFNIVASKGHVRDLLKTGERKMGIDVHGDFHGEYGEIPTKKKAISELRAAARMAKEIYLAPDPDREGEAIAWHIQEILREQGKNHNIFRVSFNEITPRAVRESLSNPRKIDQKKVDAQETRRKLDRIVGFKLSGEILWNKVAFGLSAGRVQSVALRLLCERENEIDAFESTEYWTITTFVEKSGVTPAFEAKLHRINGEEPEIPNEERARELASIIEKASLRASKVERRERRQRPRAPFITSTLQQECSTKLRYGAKRTMSLAQSLYEGVNLGRGQGNVGLITYMRTDSVRLAPEAIQMARAYIGKNFKGPYLPEKPPVYKSKANIQDAHEAVRPTDVSLTPDDLKGHLKPEQLAVYTLIWRRFLASQMTPAVYDQTTVDIMADDLLLRASGSILKFSGFLEVYQDTNTEDAMNGDGERTSTGRDRLLPPIEENDPVTLLSTEAAESGVLPEQHFTQPPPRYSEASLVKELEEDGVGRPSTYASIIDTLEKRRYVVLERRKRQFTPTPLGREVNNLLVEGFPDEINVKFTAKVESDLDEIESGDKEWLPILRDFYVEFDKKIQAAKGTLPNLKTKTEPIGRDCPDCGEPLVKKFSRNGWFISCSKYPDCKHSESIPTGDEDESETDEAMAEIEEKAPPCEDCGEPMQVKRGPYGLYLCCSAQPKEHKTRKMQAGGQPVEASVPTGVACARPKCGGEMVSRRARRTGKIFYGCNQFPKCNYAVWDLPVERECPTCEHPHITLKTTKKSGTQMVCPVKSCDYKEEAPPNLVSLAKSALQGVAQKQEQPT